MHQRNPLLPTASIESLLPAKEAVTLGHMVGSVEGQEWGTQQSQGGTAELRSAVRFPLQIPVTVFAGDETLEATTVDISANGVLFVTTTVLPLQMQVQFTLKMPAEAMGTTVDVIVHCGGRVVRCTSSGDLTRIAAMIDEYYFSQ